MYAIYVYIDPSNHPNVGIYGIHGVSGYRSDAFYSVRSVLVPIVDIGQEPWNSSRPIAPFLRRDRWLRTRADSWARWLWISGTEPGDLRSPRARSALQRSKVRSEHGNHAARRLYRRRPNG